MTLKPTLLITGGFGNLGSWLTRHFLNKGYHVTVLSRRKRAHLDYLPVEFIPCDIREEAACQRALENHQFDFVIHTASANISTEAGFAQTALLTNSLGTRNLLQALSKQPAKHFLYLSTFQVYGQYSGEITENTPVNPVNDYGLSHYFAERYVRQYHFLSGLPYSIIRLTNSYGVPLDPHTTKWNLVLNDLARMAFSHQKIELSSNGHATRDFIWMGEVCAVLQQLLELSAPPNQTFNLSNEHSFSILEVAKFVQKAYQAYSGQKIPLLVNSKDMSLPPGPLRVLSRPLQQITQWDRQVRFSSEALNIFKLLELTKRQERKS